MQGQTPGYVLTQSITAPRTADLATLDDVKDELDITEDSQDARLCRYIREESAGLARYCNRIFGRAVWYDLFRPQRGIWGEGVQAANNPLMTAHWPLAGAPVAFTANLVLNNTVITGVSSTAGLARWQPVFGAGITAGTFIKAIAPSSIVLSAPVTAAGTAVALSANVGVLETLAGVSTWLVPGTDYEASGGNPMPGAENSAELYRLNELGNPRTWPPTKVEVWYSAGYRLPWNGDSDQDDEDFGCGVPDDLAKACILLVTTRYRARGRDPMLVERSINGQGLGHERFWVGATPGQTGPYPNEIMSLIERFRVPVTG